MKDWNIKQPTLHAGDIIGNKCRKLMAWTRLIFEQMKAYSLEQLTGDDQSEQREK
jgi:hypothetical protein